MNITSSNSFFSLFSFYQNFSFYDNNFQLNKNYLFLKNMRDFVHKFLELTIGNIFGKDVTCREPIHRCDAYQPGVMVEIGRTTIKVILNYRVEVKL